MSEWEPEQVSEREPEQVSGWEPEQPSDRVEPEQLSEVRASV